MKIVINPVYQQLTSFIENIPVLFDKGGELVYDGRNKLKVYEVGGYEVIVKSFKVPHVINRLVYTHFRLSKARRSYEYAFELKERGFLTPDPIAYIEIKNTLGLLSRSYYISIFEKDFSTIRKEMMGEKDEYFLTELACFISQLHAKGVLNTDLSPGNILAKREEDKILFSLVDINRIKFLDSLSLKDRYKNFERICERRETVNYLVKKYAECSLLDEELSLREVDKYIARFSKKYQ